MKLGLFMVLFKNIPFEQALDKVKENGLEAVEIGTGGYPGKDHCDPEVLLQNTQKLKDFQKAITDRGLIISGLSCHGNPLHPRKELAKRFHDDWRKTVLLAEKLGVDRIILFSGCPGDQNSLYPNWVVSRWPNDFPELLKWQWEEIVIPYWREEVKYAQEHRVTKLCFEMHPGFVVYNPETLLKLRQAVGEVVGANFDPGHLFWQGIDPVVAIRGLGKEGAIYHFHAKDTALDPINLYLNGVLDTKPATDILNCSWAFRSVGYGHGFSTWKNIVSALRIVGYDYVLSIEHEDLLASKDEGLRKAVSFLKDCILEESPPTPWWL